MVDKELLGFLAITVGLIAFIPYIWSVLKGKTKPHIFSWLVWGIIMIFVCVAQLSDHAGPGAWVTGVDGTLCLFIAILAFFKGEKNITKSDWISFTGALVTIPLWYVTKTPLFSVILATIIDMLGYYPTFRKSYHKPHEELAITYILSNLSFILSLFAMAHFSLVTTLYPFSIIVTNCAFVLMLLWRRTILTRA